MHPSLRPYDAPEFIEEFYLTPQMGWEYRILLIWNKWQRRITRYEILAIRLDQDEMNEAFYKDLYEDEGTLYLGVELHRAAYRYVAGYWERGIYVMGGFDTYYDALLYLRAHLVYCETKGGNGVAAGWWYEWKD